MLQNVYEGLNALLNELFNHFFRTKLKGSITVRFPGEEPVTIWRILDVTCSLQMIFSICEFCLFHRNTACWEESIVVFYFGLAILPFPKIVWWGLIESNNLYDLQKYILNFGGNPPQMTAAWTPAFINFISSTYNICQNVIFLEMTMLPKPGAGVTW